MRPFDQVKSVCGDCSGEFGGIFKISYSKSTWYPPPVCCCHSVIHLIFISSSFGVFLLLLSITICWTSLLIMPFICAKLSRLISTIFNWIPCIAAPALSLLELCDFCVHSHKVKHSVVWSPGTWRLAPDSLQCIRRSPAHLELVIKHSRHSLNFKLQFYFLGPFPFLLLPFPPSHRTISWNSFSLLALQIWIHSILALRLRAIAVVSLHRVPHQDAHVVLMVCVIVSLTMPHSEHRTMHFIMRFRYFVGRESAVNLFLPTTNVFQQSTLMVDGSLLATKKPWKQRWACQWQKKNP